MHDLYDMDPRFKYVSSNYGHTIRLLVFVVVSDVIFMVGMLLHYMFLGCTLERVVIDAGKCAHLLKY